MYIYISKSIHVHDKDMHVITDVCIHTSKSLHIHLFIIYTYTCLHIDICIHEYACTHFDIHRDVYICVESAFNFGQVAACMIAHTVYVH